LVRRARPQKVGKTRCQLEIADTIIRAGRDALRRPLKTKYERRVRQHGLDGQTHAIVEIDLIPALLIGRHEFFDVGVGRGLAIRLPRQSGHDSLGAPNFTAALGVRTADENPRARRRLRNAANAIRSVNAKIAHVRRRCQPRILAAKIVAQNALVGHHEILHGTVRLRNERG
jgi:hypothetical protein